MFCKKKKSFDTPDHLVAPDKTKAEILEFDTVKVVGVTGQFKAIWGISRSLRNHR